MPNSRSTNLYPKVVTGHTDQALAVGNSVVQFGAFSSTCKYVVLDVQVADVRVTYDGSDPDNTQDSGTANGHILFAGRSYTWAVETARAAKFIENTTTDAIIHASEFTD
jgi:hypothetical protein